MEKLVQFEAHYSLVQKCKEGDRNAQFEIYKLYSRSMYNVCLRMMNDSEEAKDIMQDGFIQAFQQLGSFQGTSTFGAWLKRIMINQAIDALRKKRVKFENIDTIDVSDNQPEDFSESNEWMVQRIKNTLRLLPDGYRTVLSLYLFEGYDHEEISEILKISEGTSRSQYLRAKSKLLELLNEDREHGKQSIKGIYSEK